MQYAFLSGRAKSKQYRSPRIKVSEVYSYKECNSTMGRAVMEQIYLLKQEIASLIIRQRIAPSMNRSPANFHRFKWFLYLIFVSFRAITLKSSSPRILPRTVGVPIIMEVKRGEVEVVHRR